MLVTTFDSVNSWSPANYRPQIYGFYWFLLKFGFYFSICLILTIFTPSDLNSRRGLIPVLHFPPIPLKTPFRRFGKFPQPISKSSTQFGTIFCENPLDCGSILATSVKDRALPAFRYWKGNVFQLDRDNPIWTELWRRNFGGNLVVGRINFSRNFAEYQNVFVWSVQWACELQFFTYVFLLRIPKRQKIAKSVKFGENLKIGGNRSWLLAELTSQRRY